MKLNVKLKGTPKPIQVPGESFEDDKENGELRVNGDSGKVTAKFDTSEIAGWWVEPEYKLSAEDLRRAREIAKQTKPANE